MKKLRSFPKPIPPQKKQETNPPSVFVLCEKSTGAARFHAETSGDPDYIIERMAGLLAVQCLVHGSDPGDFAVLVPVPSLLGNRLVTRAQELLAQGRQAASPATLSPRQKEILQSVMSNRANKEIASQLNITVRTVKFHISSLLSKFGAENRTELARRAAALLRPEPSLAEPLNLDQRRGRQGPSELDPLALGGRLHATSKSRPARFGERVLTA